MNPNLNASMEWRGSHKRFVAPPPIVTTGWLNLTTFAGDTSNGGTLGWSSHSNAQTSNDAKAQAVTFGANVKTQYLKALGIATPIPAGSTILGVEARVEKSKTNTAGFLVSDTEVRLFVAGVHAGDNKFAAGEWPFTDAYTVYGGLSDLWGLGLTVAQVNAADFGFGIACFQTAPGFTRLSYIDHVQMRFRYQEAG